MATKASLDFSDHYMQPRAVKTFSNTRQTPKCHHVQPIPAYLQIRECDQKLFISFLNQTTLKTNV